MQKFGILMGSCILIGVCIYVIIKLETKLFNIMMIVSQVLALIQAIIF